MALKTITVSGNPQIEEAVANAAITPGDLIEFLPNSSLRHVRRHATSDGAASPMFATENELFGDEIGTDYASGDTTRFAVFGKGDVVNARLAASQGAIHSGDWLSSNSGGTLQTTTSNNDRVRVVQSDQFLADSASVQRIKVRP